MRDWTAEATRLLREWDESVGGARGRRLAWSQHRARLVERIARFAAEAAREAAEQSARVVEAFDDDASDGRLRLAAERIRALGRGAP